MKHHFLAPSRALARRTPIPTTCVLISTLAGFPVQAAEQAGILEEVVISATRTPEHSNAVPATITTQDARRIERQHPTDETALFKDEPDVDVSRDRRRFGAGSINIRGIEDNRVLQMVDGVRLPDFYNVGGPSNVGTATRDAPEFSFLKRVEVLRGPASSLYGSDAIGGVVSYATKDPVDLMRGRSMGGEAGLDWNGVDNGFRQTFGIAGGDDTLQAMFLYAHRKSQEMKNKGEDDSVSTGRTKPNPQDVETNAWLGKLVWNASQTQHFKLAYEHRDADSYTNMLRLSPTLPRVTSAEGNEGLSRERVSLDYEWLPIDGLLDRLSAQIYYQLASTDTGTEQIRSNTSASCSASTRGTNQCKVDLDFGFKQEEQGINLQADKSFATGSIEHHLIGGIDYLQMRSSEVRDGLVRNLTTGASTKTLAGETFPIHDFPTGLTRQTGIFIQDELRYGAFTVTPGLRFDHYSLGPDSDDATYERVAGRTPVDKSDSAVSPKLAAIWRATDHVNVWAQYVYGFRAPNYQEVNGAFINPVMGYGAAPNPDLKAEKSRSFEIGARYGTEMLQTSVALFDNRYKDFIEQVQLDCPSDPSCMPGLFATFQDRNVSKVRIYGAEWRGVWRFLPQWRVDGAVAYAHGTNEDTDQPLNSVSPLRASAGLGWELEQGRGAEVRWRGARPVTRTDDTSFEYFKPSGYGVVDLNGWWKFNEYASVQLSVDNVFDQKYWLWGDVRSTGVAATDPGLDFYTQPGRTFAASVKLTF